LKPQGAFGKAAPMRRNVMYASNLKKFIIVAILAQFLPSCNASGGGGAGFGQKRKNPAK
jgi:hypothetical protein